MTWNHSSSAVITLLLALLLAPAVAHADPATHLSPGRVIAIASTDPSVAPLLLANPGAHWEVVYDRPHHAWTAALESKGKHTVLASFRIDDRTSAILSTDIVSKLGPPRLTSAEAIRLAHRSAALRDWIGQYTGVQPSASLGDDRVWTIKYDDGAGSEVAEARVDDTSISLVGVRTGPQVDWQLARGEPSSYGRLANRWWIFLPLCAVFLGGLVDWRRPFTMRTLDLLVLLSFGISLHWFNKGDLFVSTPLTYPPLVYLLVRMLQLGTSRRPRSIEIGPRHALVLVGLCFALVGFRLGLNNRDSNILDVGYAGVVGADRLLNGTLPYGHMPTKSGEPCAGHYAGGDPIGYVQSTSGRCESAIESGDTYGPAVYVAYMPFVAIFGWGGLWDDLPAAHVAASAFDLLAIAGLFVAGWRFGNPRLGVLLAFAWAANPFTLYALNMNTNDALVGALLAWFMAALSIPLVRGGLIAAAGLTKLGPLALVPLVLSLRRRWATVAGMAVVALALVSMLALQSDGIRLFWDNTFHYQLNRVTPLSIWTIGTFHPGWPNLHWLQQALQVVVVIGCLLLSILPRGRKDGVAVAALAAAALVATQLVSSYWFYPYICWWLPLVLFAMLVPREPVARQPLSPR